jgi:integrase
VPKLTKKIVDGLRPATGGADVFAWDSELRGFGVRLKPSGAGSFVVQYRTPEGRTRRLAIGKMGTLLPEEARKLARERLAAVAAGADPSRDRHKARESLSVGDVLDRYLEAVRAGLVSTRFRQPKRASTIAMDEGRISRHIRPLIGRDLVASLARADIQRMADAIAQGKTAGTFKTKPRGKAVVRGGGGAAARVVGLLGGIWTWAAKRGLVTGQNPARGVDTTAGTAKDRVLAPAELKALGAALRDNAPARPLAVAALRLITLTGMRREEVCGLRWREIDTAGSCIKLETTKTGRSTRPIGAPALELIRSLRQQKIERDENVAPDHEFIFPNRTGRGSADLKKAIAAIFDGAGLTDARSHDLRRTFASIAADEGYGDATIGELLGHARRGVTARHYIRRADPALIAAADRVATRISALLEGTRGQ